MKRVGRSTIGARCLGFIRTCLVVIVAYGGRAAMNAKAWGSHGNQRLRAKKYWTPENESMCTCTYVSLLFTLVANSKEVPFEDGGGRHLLRPSFPPLPPSLLPNIENTIRKSHIYAKGQKSWQFELFPQFLSQRLEDFRLVLHFSGLIEQMTRFGGF